VTDGELKHRLSAILAADAVAFSRLMAVDDKATVAALDVARALFTAAVQANHGRVIDMAGDSVLAAFDTATGAVMAALAVQEQVEAAVRETPEDRRMHFRIGVHLGDVIEKADGTIYGDGVNIAARLQALAEPGGILISDAVRGSVGGRLIATVTDEGVQTVKNIHEPVRTFSVRRRETGSMSVAVDAAARGRPQEKPSIAVLPFKIFSDDCRIGFLADGLVEDVIALLARVPGFLLISQSSSFVFRDRKENISAIARQLGVRYVVEGSVRPIGSVVRVSTQLVEAESGRVLWSGRFDSKDDETPDLQDAIARGVISELEPELTRAEIALIKRQRPDSVDAWGSYRQAVGAIALKGWTEESVSEARVSFQRALSIDPTFGLAHAQLALVTSLGVNTGVLAASPELAEGARAAAEQAISIDDGSAEVLGYAGCALADLGFHDRGAEILERAVEIDPSNAQAHVALGATNVRLGRVEAGIARMRYGMRISPRDRRLGFWSWAVGGFLLRAGRAEDALLEARAATSRDPKLHLARILEAAALQSLGRDDEARVALGVARKLRAVLTLEEVARVYGRRVAKKLSLLWESPETRT
jgi:adenylate cyclase